MSLGTMLNARTINYLEQIGNGKRYRVPPYQRDYSWSEEQWDDLWNDIVELHTKPDSYHYMGALVVQEESDRDLLIIDGQQRMATLSIFALAVIALLDDLAGKGIEPERNRERMRELRNRFIGERDPASLIESSRLTLNENDNPFYQDYLVQLRKPQHPRGLSWSNRLLWECFRFFKDRLGQLFAHSRDGAAITRLLSETVARRLLFILITVADDLNAYTIFETLNARGLELTVTDLLKNYLFSRVHVASDLQALQRRWQRLIATVTPERFPEFLRYHLLCEVPQVRSQRLFKLVRERVQTPQQVFTLLEALEARAELFAALSDPAHGYWNDLTEARQYIRELNLFRVKQMTPVLFAAWEHLTPDNVVRVLRMISIISFRYTVVSALNPNELESIYHEAARAIIEQRVTTPAELFAILKPNLCSRPKVHKRFCHPCHSHQWSTEKAGQIHPGHARKSMVGSFLRSGDRPGFDRAHLARKPNSGVGRVVPPYPMGVGCLSARQPHAAITRRQPSPRKRSLPGKASSLQSEQLHPHPPYS